MKTTRLIEAAASTGAGVLLAIAFVTGSALGSSCGWSSGWSRPSAVVDSPLAELGDVTRGQKVEHVFYVHNVGHAPLTLDADDPHCGCQSMPVVSRVIAPGQAGTIRVLLDTTKVAEGRIYGVETTLRTNDPGHATLVVSLAATVHSEFVVSPAALEFRGGEDRGAVKTIQVRRAPNSKASIVSAASSDNRVIASLQANPAGTISIVEASERTDGEPASHFGNIVLTTTSSFLPEIRIPVSGTAP